MSPFPLPLAIGLHAAGLGISQKIVNMRSGVRGSYDLIKNNPNQNTRSYKYVKGECRVDRGTLRNLRSSVRAFVGSAMKNCSREPALKPALKPLVSPFSKAVIAAGLPFVGHSIRRTNADKFPVEATKAAHMEKKETFVDSHMDFRKRCMDRDADIFQIGLNRSRPEFAGNVDKFEKIYRNTYQGIFEIMTKNANSSRSPLENLRYILSSASKGAIHDVKISGLPGAREYAFAWSAFEAPFESFPPPVVEPRVPVRAAPVPPKDIPAFPHGESKKCIAFIASILNARNTIFEGKKVLLGELMEKSGVPLDCARGRCEGIFRNHYLREFESFMRGKTDEEKSSEAVFYRAHAHAEKTAVAHLQSSRDTDVGNYGKFLSRFEVRYQKRAMPAAVPPPVPDRSGKLVYQRNV